MAKKEVKYCEHCGASMNSNKYTLNMTLVRALAKLAKHPGVKAREIMDRSEYAVYTKLKFWDFAQKEEDGVWYITDLGLKFLRGEISAAREITYFRDKMVAHNNEFTKINGVFPTPESKQKYRDYMEAVL